MTSRPSKPWRVTLSGPAFLSETEHTSEAKAYDHLRTELTRPDSKALTARVMQWSDGRWWHFETVHASELPSSAWFPTA